MKSNGAMRQYLIFFVKLSGGCAVLFYMFQKMEMDVFLKNFKTISWHLFILLLLISFLDRFLMGYKWNLLLRSKGLNIPLSKAVSLYLVSNLLGAFTPGNIGGDVYRVMKLTPLCGGAVVLATVILERFFGILALTIFVALSLPFIFTFVGGGFGIGGVVSVIIIISIISLIFLMFFGQLSLKVTKIFSYSKSLILEKITSLLISLRELNENRRVVYIFFLLTMCEMCVYFMRDFLAARSAGVPVALTYIFIAMPLVALTLRLPITIQGIGVQEGLFAYVLSLAGFSIAEGVFVSLVWRLADIIAVYLPAYSLYCLFPKLYRIGKD